MKIAKNTVVSLAYKVRTKDGVLVDEATAVAPLEYLQGAGNLLQDLENALEGHQVGDKFDVELVNPYGDFNDALVQNVPRDVFVGVDELEVGMRFFADTDQGSLPVEITAIDGDTVTIDGNHGHGGCGCGGHGHDHEDEEESGCCGGGHGSCGCH